MALRMKWFLCQECDESFEELVDYEDAWAECPKCKKEAPLDPDFRKQIHHDGLKYRHVSWSLHNVS